MKRQYLLCFLMLFATHPLIFGYNILYAEQFYKLYHRHFYQYPEDLNENIVYLEKALSSPLCNPLNALATIENEKEWIRYKYLFYMHVNLKLVELYRLQASKYDKRTAFFYNAPWQQTNLESLEIAESYYLSAFHYWNEAVFWAKKADHTQHFDLQEIQNWDDERYRIKMGDLNYADILSMDLDRVEYVRNAFRNMDENTY